MSAGSTAKTGVVVLAMGGATTPEDVKPFLRRLFADPAIIKAPLGPLRPLLARLIATLRAPSAGRRYARVGGSPLIEETRLQADALARALAPDGLPVQMALTLAPPFAQGALERLAHQGVTRVLALPLFPQRSETTTGSALAALGRAAQRLGLAVQELPPYPTLPGFIAPMANDVRRAVAELETHYPRRVAVLLTAHGLPERYVAAGDPYVDQVHQTADALREALGSVPCPVALGFQSRIGPVRWVGPQVEDEVTRLAAAGYQALVVLPITFVCEHLETLWDLDNALRTHASNAGLQAYRRLPTVGTHPEFIQGLADHVRTQVAP